MHLIEGAGPHHRNAAAAPGLTGGQVPLELSREIKYGAVRVLLTQPPRDDSDIGMALEKFRRRFQPSIAQFAVSIHELQVLRVVSRQSQPLASLVACSRRGERLGGVKRVGL